MVFGEITRKEKIYFKTPLNSNNNLTWWLKQDLSGKVIIEIQTPNNSTGATSIIWIKDYLSPKIIYQTYYTEAIIIALVIVALGIYKVIKD